MASPGFSRRGNALFLSVSRCSSAGDVDCAFGDSGVPAGETRGGGPWRTFGGVANGGCVGGATVIDGDAIGEVSGGVLFGSAAASGVARGCAGGAALCCGAVSTGAGVGRIAGVALATGATLGRAGVVVAAGVNGAPFVVTGNAPGFVNFFAGAFDGGVASVFIFARACSACCTLIADQPRSALIIQMRDV